MTNIYIFVDESGNFSQDECCTLAATWCVSRRSSPAEVLSPTKNRLLNLANGCSGRSHSELKGSALHPDTLTSVVKAIPQHAKADDTIRRENLPWERSSPLGVTLHGGNPQLSKQVVTGSIQGGSTETSLKAWTLSTVLTPLFHPHRITAKDINRAQVILDAETWEKPGKKVQQHISVDSIVVDDIQFFTEDSRSTPGIQLADLAAYTCRRNSTRGDTGVAESTLRRHLISL